MIQKKNCVAYSQNSDSPLVYFFAIATVSVDGRSLWIVSRQMESQYGLFFACSSRMQEVRICTSVHLVAVIYRCDG